RRCCRRAPTFLDDQNRVANTRINRIKRQHGVTRLVTFRCDLLAQHHARVLVAPVLLRGHDVSNYARENHLLTCCSESTIPTIVQSVGVSSRLKGKLASLPRHQKTSSPIPAPTESIATIGFPDASRFRSTVCTMSSFRPASESFLMVATTVPMTRASCMISSHQPYQSLPQSLHPPAHLSCPG